MKRIRIIGLGRYRRSTSRGIALSGVLACAVALGLPGAVLALPLTSTVDPGNRMQGLACPSVAQCTATDQKGKEVTFNPISPGHATPVTIDPGRGLGRIACPSIAQCTTVDYLSSGVGRELTFNPHAPGTPTPIPIDGFLQVFPCPGSRHVFDAPAGAEDCLQEGGGAVGDISCPAISQCTGVDNTGKEVTFNPVSPAAPKPSLVDVRARIPVLSRVACPTVDECIALDPMENTAVTFNPNVKGTATGFPLGAVEGGSLACPSPSQCTAVGARREGTFNPISRETLTPITYVAGPLYIPVGEYAVVACSSVSQCTVVFRYYLMTRERTFNPMSRSILPPVTIKPGFATAVACPSATQCTAVDGAEEVTFNPQSVTEAPAVKCRVPKLKGKTFAQAERLLTHALCELGNRVITRATHKRPLVVVRQKPAANRVLPGGAKVSLWLG